jgi:large subunit ribosomal protein L20
MVRVTSGPARRARHKKIRRLVKGYRGMRRTTFKNANQAVMKAGQHSYRDRKRKKRVFRALWIVRLNAALRENGIPYSRFIKAMKDKKVNLDRQTLSEIAINDPDVFTKIVEGVWGRKVEKPLPSPSLSK